MAASESQERAGQFLIDHAFGKRACRPESERALAVAGRTGDQFVVTSPIGSQLVDLETLEVVQKLCYVGPRARPDRDGRTVP